MRVLILGGGGMLGHKAYQVLSPQMDTWVTFRRFSRALEATCIFRRDRVLEGIDATDIATVQRALDASRPDCVINCIGVIKQLPEATDPRVSIRINALFPHLLADLCTGCGARLIHISTDCVFSGVRGAYNEDDVPDAHDLYGRTKALGETTEGRALTLRTSIIGRDLFHDVSLVDWFLAQRGGHVRGFVNALYSGLTTVALARELSRLVTDLPDLRGLFQVAGERISKYELLTLLRRAYAVDVGIEPDTAFRCDRSLCGDRYQAATGFQVQSWPDMVDAMANDPTPYEKFRQAAQSETAAGK